MLKEGEDSHRLQITNLKSSGLIFQDAQTVTWLHTKLCLLLWFEFFRTIALFLGALRDFIAGYLNSSAASVECRREIFGRANFHPSVVSLRSPPRSS